MGIGGDRPAGGLLFGAPDPRGAVMELAMDELALAALDPRLRVGDEALGDAGVERHAVADIHRRPHLVVVGATLLRRRQCYSRFDARQELLRVGQRRGRGATFRGRLSLAVQPALEASLGAIAAGGGAARGS